MRWIDRRVRRQQLLLLVLGFLFSLMVINDIRARSVIYLQEEPFSNFHWPMEIDLSRVLQSNGKVDPEIPPIHQFQQVNIENRSKCKQSDTSKNVILFAVKSKASNFGLRQKIRQTWGTETQTEHFEFRTMFLLGYINPKLQEKIKSENVVHGDILQGAFLDDYWNNVDKTKMAFQWIGRNCQGVQLVMFVDDDCFVCKHNLLDYLKKSYSIQTQKERENTFFGYKVIKARPRRDSSDTWSVSTSEYPFSYYPTYLTGGAYIASIENVRKCAVAMDYVNKFRIDDVYVGIVAWKLKLSLVNNKDFIFDERTTALPKTVIASHHLYVNSDEVQNYCKVEKNTELL